MDMRSILIMLGIGLVAGWLASLVVGAGGGLIGILVAGVLGSFVGGYLFSAFKINLKIGSPLITQIITSTAGAIIVIILARVIT